MRGALDGIRVTDLSRVLAGPYCTMVLADLGADVIKVESPTGGDETRGWGPPFVSGVSAYYLCANRNKRSIAVDLKSDVGRDVVTRLVSQSDVLIENFRPGKADNLGFGYEQMQQLNPRLVYCSISGFGQTGPYRDLPGYDFVIQAMSGLMSITGYPDGPPTKVGVAVGDVFAGLYAAIAILAALRAREQTGSGQYIDVALFDAQIAALVNVASNYLASGKVPARQGNQHPNIVPYQTFAVLDGDIAVAVGNDQQFTRLCEVLGMPELARDARFSTNHQRVIHKEQLIPLLQSVFATKDCSTWMNRLTKHEIPCGPINTLDGLFADPQLAARGMVQAVHHPRAGEVQLVGNPIHMSQSEVTTKRHPPDLGEHTSEVLLELGFTSEQIDAWTLQGVVRNGVENSAT